MKAKLLLAISFLFLLFSCKKENSQEEIESKNTFAKGADISWLPQMEASGYTFYNADGKPEDCFKILKDHGINSIRLRTFVNPSDDRQSGHCSKDETVAMAKKQNSGE